MIKEIYKGDERENYSRRVFPGIMTHTLGGSVVDYHELAPNDYSDGRKSEAWTFYFPRQSHAVVRYEVIATVRVLNSRPVDLVKVTLIGSTPAVIGLEERITEEIAKKH